MGERSSSITKNWFCSQTPCLFLFVLLLGEWKSQLPPCEAGGLPIETGMGYKKPGCWLFGLPGQVAQKAFCISEDTGKASASSLEMQGNGACRSQGKHCFYLLLQADHLPASAPAKKASASIEWELSPSKWSSCINGRNTVHRNIRQRFCSVMQKWVECLGWMLWLAGK